MESKQELKYCQMAEENHGTIEPFKIEQSWLNILREEFFHPYFSTLLNNYLQEEKTHKTYPDCSLIFEAFNRTPFEKVKVIIIGQDPYHGQGQANGLCFSVNDGVKHPPSLKNLLKELSFDTKCSYPKSGDLSPWADQGVLLLNATLTVRKDEANSHRDLGWQRFTDGVIEKLSSEKMGLIFLLWGGFAQRKGNNIDCSKHHVLTSGHPSPLSANRGHWFNNCHFTKTNRLLTEQGKEPINWELV